MAETRKKGNPNPNPNPNPNGRNKEEREWNSRFKSTHSCNFIPYLYIHTDNALKTNTIPTVRAKTN